MQFMSPRCWLLHVLMILPVKLSVHAFASAHLDGYVDTRSATACLWDLDLPGTVHVEGIATWMLRPGSTGRICPCCHRAM
jgi:hypothetical protein